MEPVVMEVPARGAMAALLTAATAASDPVFGMPVGSPWPRVLYRT